MGKDEMTLYYHLRLLSSNGLIDAEIRPGTTKPETVFGEETAQWARSFFAERGSARRRCIRVLIQRHWGRGEGERSSKLSCSGLVVVVHFAAMGDRPGWIESVRSFLRVPDNPV